MWGAIEDVCLRTGSASMARYHRDHPYTLSVNAMEYRVDYVTGGVDNWPIGGNWVWRGRI